MVTGDPDVRAVEIRRMDRRLIKAVWITFSLGLAALVFGGFEVWWDFFQGHGLHGRRALKGLIGLLLTGPALIGLAIFEVAHRLRKAPQEPGRHSRPID